MGVLMLCYLAYCGFGPALVMSFSGDKDVTYLGVDLADYAFTSGLISLVSFISVMIGYRMTKDKIPADVVTVTPPQFSGRCQQRPHVGGYYNRFPQTQKQSQTDNNLKK